MSFVNPLTALSGLFRHRYLLGQLVKRDVLLRYCGAMFGAAWLNLHVHRAIAYANVVNPE